MFCCWRCARHAPRCGSFQVAGFFDDTKPAGTATPHGPVFGPIASLAHETLGERIDALAMGVGYRHMDFRSACFEQQRRRMPFATLVHESCVVDPSATVGEGAFLLPGCVIDAGVRIGANVLLNTACVVAHDSVVDDGSFLGPGVALAGFVTVRSGVVLGIRTVVVDGVSIASGVQTGAGAVVTEILSEPGLYVGVPARRIR